jgi:hypothetical protein
LQSPTPGFVEAPPKINSDMAWESGHTLKEEPRKSLKNFSNLSARPNGTLASFVAIGSKENINPAA